MDRMMRTKQLLLLILACLLYNLSFATEDPALKAKLSEKQLQRAA